MRTDFSYFESLWRKLGTAAGGMDAHRELMARYSESQRAYHTVQHLDECLRAFDPARAEGMMAKPDAVEMALWFHDAVYQPQATDNEEQSAALARRMLESAGVGPGFVAEVERLVMATKSHLAAPDDDSAWMVDIDLAILGQPADRFGQYEAQILLEYNWVPLPLYLQKRAEVLLHFLDRGRLYVTGFFQDRLDVQARRNLTHAIAGLRAGTP